MVTALDISTDPGCGRVTNPDMVVCCSLGPDVTMFLVGSTGYSGLNTSWFSDSNLYSGGWFDPVLHGTQWQLGPLMSVWALSATGPRTQRWSLAIVRVQMTTWPRVVAQDIHICIVPAVAWPRDSTQAAGSGPGPGLLGWP